MDSSGRLLSVDPEELVFQIELEKQCFSELKVANDSEHHVAFKVKTTTPKKYCVRPNAGVLQPWGSCMIKDVFTVLPGYHYAKMYFFTVVHIPPSEPIEPVNSFGFPSYPIFCELTVLARTGLWLNLFNTVGSDQVLKMVLMNSIDKKLPIRKHLQFDSDLVLCKSLPFEVTLQSQQEYPPDMQCKDKFLLQSTKVPPDINVDEIPPDTFSKEGDKVIEEYKLRVIYRIANAGQRSLGAETSLGNSKQSSDASSGQVGLYRLKDERDSALYSNQLLRQELEKMKRRRSHGGDGEGGLSLTFVTFVGVAGIIFGVMLNLVFSSPSSE